MEEQGGKGVKMADIAEAAGISRQAIYLHFSTRTELMVATTHYVDEVRGLSKRLAKYRAAKSGIEMLEAYVEFWGNYIPQIYGLARALIAVRDTDEAASEAWNERMNAVRNGCVRVVEALKKDNRLSSDWNLEDTVNFFWTMLSIHNWEILTAKCGWTSEKYISTLTEMLKKTLLKDS